MSQGDDETTLGELKRSVAAFNEARDWGQFHTPKDLAMAVSIEANELLELFLWRDAEAPVDEARLREELGDVCITLLNLANVTGVDLSEALRDKLALNDARYPVALSRGKALKYDEL